MENLPAEQNKDGFLAMIERLSSRPDIDVEKIQRIIDMQEQILNRNAKQAFNAAMTRTQAKMPIVPEDKKNTQTNSMYSSYEMVLKYTKHVYTDEGFSLLFYEGETQKENHIRVCVDVMHSEGHTEKRYVDVPIDNVGIKGTPNKTMTHAKGSSLSYGKSYLLRMVFNIPTGESDDDGNAASGELQAKVFVYLEDCDKNSTTLEGLKKWWSDNADKIKKELGQVHASHIYKHMIENKKILEAENATAD